MGRKKKNYDDQLLEQIVANFGASLRIARWKAGLTQTALASKAGISTSTLNEIEKGRVEDVRLRTVTAMARVLKADPLDLLQEPSVSDQEAYRRALSQDALPTLKRTARGKSR